MVAVDRSWSGKQEMIDGENLSAGFSDLMPELLTMIAESLSSYVDYVHFRRCNKACANIGPRKNPFQPCLIYRDEDDNGLYQYYITDINLNQKLCINNIPEKLRMQSILSCRDGWLLLGDTYGACYTLFNPFTAQVVQTVCDSSKISPEFSVLIISGNPSKTSPVNCTVLSLDDYQQQQQYCTEPGKAECWVLALPPGIFWESGGVLWRGCWYIRKKCDGSLKCLRLYRLSPEECGWEVLHGLTFADHRSARSFYLIECGGDLLSLFVDDKNIKNPWARVLKLKDDEKTWEEIDSLKGYSLYLGYQTSMSCLAESPDLADRIYFHCVYYNDGLVYYSLRTKKCHKIGDEQTELKTSESCTWPRGLNSLWIKPEWN